VHRLRYQKISKKEAMCSFPNVCIEVPYKTTRYCGTAKTSALSGSIANRMLTPSKKLSDIYSSLLPSTFALAFVPIYPPSKREREKKKRVKECANLLTSYKY
jgi:hypothetical protein